MAVYRACYVTREDVQRALDIAPSLIDYARIDRAVQSASEDIDGLTHRRFFFSFETHYWDWPNFQYSYPWRIWLDQAELASVTGSYAPVVTSGGVVIPASEIFWRPWNYGPPFYAVELNRSTSAAFGVSATPQQDVAITGYFGYWTAKNPAGTLATNVATTTALTLNCSDAAAIGVGDVLTVDSEMMLVQDRGWFDTSQTLVSGGSTALSSDNTLVFSGGAYFAGEVLLLDSEQVLVLVASGAANSYTVKRAWNGTVLATHTGSEVFAERTLTVSRGDYGSTAATHTAGVVLSVNKIPPLVEDLALSEAINNVLQETAGYAATMGEAGASQMAVGGDLAMLRDQVLTRYGRKNRQRVI